MKKIGRDFISLGIAAIAATGLIVVQKRRRAKRFKKLTRERKLMLALREEIEETLRHPDHEFNLRITREVTKDNSDDLQKVRDKLEEHSVVKERGMKDACLHVASHFLNKAMEHSDKVMKSFHDLM